MNTETLVKYRSKNKVVITMDIEHYEKLCKGYNRLRRALNMMTETNDLYLSDMRNLDDLSYAMQCLGFERGENYWSDVTLPKEQKK
tara:strand:+ start:169 stop:426 length:258 start_codon:yes stop_codon:yes gene_type:complete